MTELIDNLKTRQEMFEHNRLVEQLIQCFISDLSIRGRVHDASKLDEPEYTGFCEVTHKLKKLTYGSPAYFKCLKEMKPFLDHHYACNSHHPEHFENGISGMTIIDLVEMFADWWAATKKHEDGDITKSIQVNQKRFNLPEELVGIFKNTVKEFSKRKGFLK